MFRLTGSTRWPVLAVMLAVWAAGSTLLAGVPNLGRESPPGGIEERAAAVQATAPDFTLDAAQGGSWTLSRALENGPVVLIFYRGYW